VRYLENRFGYIKIGIVSTVVAALGIILLTQAQTHSAVLGSVVLFAVDLTSFWPLLYTYLPNQFTQEEMGASLGIIRTVFFLSVV
jgi:hypothetical protein